MVSYANYISSIENFRKLIETQILKPIIFESFKQERGTDVTKVLPDNTEEFELNNYNFNAVLNPDNRNIYNIKYKNNLFNTNNIASKPNNFIDIGTDIHNLWEYTYKKKRNPLNKYEIPTDKSTLNNLIKEFDKQREIICSDPQLDDLLEAVRDKNYLLAANFLNVENPQSLLEPGGGHELSELFTNGDIDIIYYDKEIALLKPKYDHETRLQGLNERNLNISIRNGDLRLTNMRLTGEQLEEAFVIGIDDTPTGLFAHVIDGTRLEPDQNVTKSYIHQVMGFDTNYKHNIETLRMNKNEKIRLQGDLAVKYLGSTDKNPQSNCYLPIDNHFVMLDKAELCENQSLENEPVKVNVSSNSVMNITHDEHENIIVNLEKGIYEFYLLHRGLKLPDERPDWPDNK